MAKIKMFYRENSMYGKLEAFWRKTCKGVMTRVQAVEFLMKELGKSQTAAQAAVNVILSPRESSDRGNPLGNRSAKGEFYFAKPLNGEKYRFMIRKTPLEGYGPRKPKKEVKATKKTTKTKTTAKTKAKKTSKKSKAKETVTA